MDQILAHYRSLPRSQLQQELRRITGIDDLYLWENLGYGWIYEGVRVGTTTAPRLGVRVGDVIGYRVIEGEVKGGAISDLFYIKEDKPPYPDPFR
jgi:hypothetical protein